MKKVLLVPFDDIDKSLLEHIKKKVEDIWGYKVEINKQLPVPQCTTRGNQLLAKDLFPALNIESMNSDAKYVLGVIDKDLYTEDLNFIFGLAFANLSVISLYRLHSEDKNLYYKRAATEAVHELGHLKGLKHCPDTKCVMHFSNTLEDTDIKEEYPCEKCK